MPFDKHHLYVDGLPAHQPVTAPDVDQKGWRALSLGEPVKTYHQVYVFAPRPRWRLSSYWTSEGLINDGRSTYRTPASIKAWIVVLPSLTRKVWRRVWDGNV